MKNTTKIALMLLAFWVYPSVNASVAGDEVVAFELPESGVAIEYPMTPNEIAVEKVKTNRIELGGENETNHPHQSYELIELTESGQIIMFPLTGDEIAERKIAKTETSVIKDKHTGNASP